MKKLFIIFSIIILFIFARFLVILFNFYNVAKFPEKAENNSINIAFITDKNYVYPLEVALKSALINKNKSSKYHIFIIGVELNNDDFKQLEQYSKDDFKITILNQKNIYKFMPSRHFWVTKADLFKFNLANIFEKFDKILYLDCDVIINKDLSELFNKALDDKYALVVQDILINDEQDIEGFYFNNGMLLLNLEKMRQDNIPLKLLSYKYFAASDRFMTQDSFNFAFKDNVYKVSPGYNLVTVRFTPENKKYLNFIDEKKYPKLSDYVEDAVIIHYAGMEKPWENKNVPWGYIWEKYAK